MKFILINTKQKIRDYVTDKLLIDGHDVKQIRSYKFLFHALNGKNIFVQENVIQDISDTKRAFIQMKGDYSDTVSLLAKILNMRKVPFNDNINLSSDGLHNKSSQVIILNERGIPVPNTIVTNIRGYQINQDYIKKQITFPCVVKFNGKQGNQVFKCQTIKEVDDLFQSKNKKKFLYTIQEYIENSYDIRILVLDGEVIGAIKRSSVDGFLNNVSKGGTAESIEITDEEKEMAINACKICEVDFGGVDIIRSERGPLVIEVNKSPQTEGFMQATDINIADKIYEYLVF